MKWWALAYIGLLMLAVKFGLWLAGPVVPFKESKAVRKLDAHYQEIERLHAQGLLPPRPVIMQPMPPQGTWAWSSASAVNVVTPQEERR